MKKQNFIQKQTAFLFFVLLSWATMAQNNLVPNTKDCSGTRPTFAFTPSILWTSSGVSNHCTPLCGDLDGDGKVEILVNGSSSNILVFDGATGASAGTITTGSINHGPSNSYCIVDVEGDGKAELFVVNTVANPPTATLYTVTSATGQRPIIFGVRWTINLPADVKHCPQTYGNIPVVADLDGDGLPEFVTGRYIIRADGTMCPTRMDLLGGLGLATWGMSVSFVADLDGDGIPEIVVGTDVYKYNGSTATLWKRCPSFPAGLEGTNIAADINLDGMVDLVFHDNAHQNAGSMVVWTPMLAPAPGVSSTQGVIGSFPTITGFSCYPVVGDIDSIVAPDGKKYPEICYNSAGNQFIAWSFNGTKFFQKFNMPTNENSGLATFTYFDFNLDGILELVYRDEQYLHVYNDTGSMPVELFRMPATSATLIENPIVADVTGDGSANIIVTGSGLLHVFEGANSKWASCPHVWNQQMYSNLLINTDLTVITGVGNAARTNIDCRSDTVRMYNGGPMQAHYVSEETYCPIDLSPDVYIVSGSITILSPTSVQISITVGNQGLAVAPSNTPIRYYQGSIAPGNLLASANTTLGTTLYPGQTTVITRTITVSSISAEFYVRLLDDGTNFPAAGTFSDCNLTNNAKHFGGFELTKTANVLSSCIGGAVAFTLTVINNSHQLGAPTTYNNLVITDSMGFGWGFISATPTEGVVTSAYNPTTHKLTWTIPALAANDTAKLIIIAYAQSAGAIRNTSWVDSVNSAPLGKDLMEAYVIVSTDTIGMPAVSPPSTNTCDGGNVPLTATGCIGALSYQWYKDGVEISGATAGTYTATTVGNYSVSYYNGICYSPPSSSATVTITLRVTPSINIRVKPR